jgi:hypothetical protein
VAQVGASTMFLSSDPATEKDAIPSANKRMARSAQSKPPFPLARFRRIRTIRDAMDGDGVLQLMVPASSS